MILAIDIGGTKIAAALFADDRMIERRSAKSSLHQDFERLPDIIADLCSDWMVICHAIGIATAGVVADGKVNFLSRRGRPSLDLGGAIARIAGKKPFILNDAWAGALGEYRHGGFSADETVVYLTVSTGVGAGIIHRGQLLRSDNGLAAHLGHMASAVDLGEKQVCACGRVNCVEMLASGTAIERRVSKLKGYKVSASEIFESQKSDHEIDRVINESASVISSLIVDCKALLGAEIFILGGSVGLADFFAERVRNHLDSFPPHWRAKVMPAEMGRDAELYGAAEAVKATLLRGHRHHHQFKEGL